MNLTDRSAEQFVCILITVVAVLPYINSLYGEFVWDDRAAVVKNSDVHGSSSLIALLIHDFWGADINSSSSHKSYRPVTVLSYRADFALYGLDTFGYHTTNILIYALSCILAYNAASQWINKTGARIAAALFVLHPVHVEAVASIVGRADSLCGMFFFAALICYTHSTALATATTAGWSKSDSAKQQYKNITNGAMQALFTAAAYTFALLAALTKEIGLTVFAVFVVMEVLEAMKREIRRSEHFKELKTKVGGDCAFLNGYLTQHSVLLGVQTLFQSVVRCLMNGPFAVGALRIATPVASVVGLLMFRRWLHGEQQLYEWTIMENHVSLMPSFLHRALSYAQYHFWYMAKLVYPRHLCFDYGYDCIPPVFSVGDWRNIGPLATYLSLGLVAWKMLREMRISLIFGFVMLVVPLVPALNVLVPVGTLLAERLLFIPSFGYCLLLGEMLSVDAAPSLEVLWDSVACFLSQRHSAAVGRKRTDGVSSAASAAAASMAHKVRLECPPQRHVTFRGKKIIGANAGAGAGSEMAMSEPKSPMANRNNGGGSSTNNRGSISENGSRNSSSSASSRSASCIVRPPQAAHSFKAVYILLLPLCAWFAATVVVRNASWRSELALFSSSLEVCPRSLKALTNYALLAMSEQRYDEALHSALAALEIHPDQIAATVNAAVAYQRMGNYSQSVDYFQRALQLQPGQAKATGYLGVTYFQWAGATAAAAAAESGDAEAGRVTATGKADKDTAHALLVEAVKWLQKAISLGFDAPTILHMSGSAMLELGMADHAVAHYRAAIEKTKANDEYFKHAAHAVREDELPDLAFAYNQLGNTLWAMQRSDEAVAAFEEGIKLFPHSIQIMTNLGSVYRDLGRTDEARRLMQRGIDLSGAQAPPALINNLGLLELTSGNYDAALKQFEDALHRHLLQTASASEAAASSAMHGEAVSPDGNSVTNVIKMNIKRARAAMIKSGR